MHKIKLLIMSLSASLLFLVTGVNAETVDMEFSGEVQLPSSITDLLDSCSGSGCPSGDIVVVSPGFMEYGGSVDYDDVSGHYRYYIQWQQERETEQADNNYRVSVYINNGNMGQYEQLFYDFGSDHQIGTTGGAETADSLLHGDEVVTAVQTLNLPLDQTTVQLNIDLTNKDEGRQKVTGKIRLPEGKNLDDPNYSYISIQPLDAARMNVYLSSWNSSPDADGLYPWTTSTKYSPDTGSRLSLNVYMDLDGISTYAYYQIGTDENDINDHTIDGDEELVPDWLDPAVNYAEFSGAVADFGIISVADFYEGSKILTGSFTPPETFPLQSGNDEYRSVYLGFQSWGQNFNFSSSAQLNENSAPSADGSYPYQILLHRDMQAGIQENGLGLTIDLNNDNYVTGENDHWDLAYSFGADNQVGGTGENKDHALGICEEPWNTMPLMLDFSAELPVVNVDIFSHVLPDTSSATVTLEVPSQIDIDTVSLGAIDTTCGHTDSYISLSRTINGTETTYEIKELIEGHEYAIITYYRNANNWYRYILNDDDGDFINGGVFLDDLTWDPLIGENIYPDPLTLVTGGEDIIISPFEFRIIEEPSPMPISVLFLLL